MRTSLLSVVATSTAAVVVTSTVIVVAHVATSTSSMNVSTSHSTAIAIIVHHTSSWFWFLSWIITAAIDILLQFIGFLVLLWINWIIRLSQFLITVGEVTLVSKCTMHMGFIMSTSFSFIFIIHLWGQLFFVTHLSIQINWVLWHTTMCVHLSLHSITHWISKLLTTTNVVSMHLLLHWLHSVHHVETKLRLVWILTGWHLLRLVHLIWHIVLIIHFLIKSSH